MTMVVVAVIVAASGLAGLVRLAGFPWARPAAIQAGDTRSRAAHTGTTPAADGQPASPDPARGGPAGGVAAVAAGPVPPSVMGALNSAKHYPRPVTSSAAGRFNVGEPHSPQLLRQLSGPQAQTARPSQPGAPAKTAAPPSTAPASPASPAPDNSASAAPVPSQSAAAHTTALITPAVTAGAPATMPQGIDVASFQHPKGAAIDWAQVAGTGYKFAAVKATEGNYYTNPYYASDVTGAKAAGLYVTGYHFAIPNVSSAVNQADYAVEKGS